MEAWKMSATGNTFVVFDNREGRFNHLDIEEVSMFYGVDGIIFVQNATNGISDFQMKYFNADGAEESMCGNGLRAISVYASEALRIKTNDQQYFNIQTKNSSYFSKPKNEEPAVEMAELYDWNSINIEDLLPEIENKMYLNTGVEHCVFEVNKLDRFDVHNIGKKIREDKRFSKGCNANFFEVYSIDHLKVRTFERGVEAETDSCGTGITAVAHYYWSIIDKKIPLKISVPGGVLKVTFSAKSKLWLEGKVEILEKINASVFEN